MIEIFKKKRSKYVESFKIMAYGKIRKVLESCETMQQLSHTRRWMAELYIIYNWDHDAYYHHLRALYETKWYEICANPLNERK